MIHLICSSVLALLLLGTSAAFAAAPEEARKAPPVTVANIARLTDFDDMLDKRVVRVVAPYSRTLYFNDKGRERGLSAELVRDFEQYLNKKYKKQLGKRPLTILLVAVTRDELLPRVTSGRADIALGNLTVTEERLKSVDMITGDDAKTQEILVTGPKSPAIATIDDLAGQTVHVRPASSYHESLVALNKRLAGEGKKEIDIVLVPDALEDEDMMEMVHVGILQSIVVDDWKAKMWAPIWPKLVLRPDVVLRKDARIGWAIRKDSPKLTAELRDFYDNWIKKQSLVAVRLQQQMKRVKQMKDPTGQEERKRFQNTVALFEKYGAQYHFDPLMLTAQGYQESQLNHNARSHVGAIGIMQLMPATGAEMKVGDIKQLEPNIHAGTKYMDFLATRYFPDAKFTDIDRALFVFASYNAGPANISRARKVAEQRGLDPNVWFNNVEIVVSERIGAETTTYARNVYKYYIAYRMIVAAQEQGGQARQAFPAPTK